MTLDLWTIGFQAVNVLVLIWLLHRFFWIPVAAMITGRQAKAVKLLNDAEAKLAESEAALKVIETTREGLVSERETILAAARKDAEAERLKLLAEARTEVSALHDAARAARVRAAAKLKKTARHDTHALALVIAGQLAARLSYTAIETVFLDWLVEGIIALPKADRQALASATTLDLVSATKTDAKAQDRISKKIIKALGAQVTLSFKVNPALIAGYELHSPHFTLRNSWAADLARIAAALDDVEADAAQPGEVRHDAA